MVILAVANLGCHQGVTRMINNKFVKSKFSAVPSTVKEVEIKTTMPNKSTNDLPTIRCTCGAKILIVPDIAAMNLAIKKHKAEHQDADEGFLAQQIIATLAKRKK